MQSVSIYANFPNTPWPLSPHCLWPPWSLQISKHFREQSHLEGVTWSLLNRLSFGFHIPFTGKSQYIPPCSLHPPHSRHQSFFFSHDLLCCSRWCLFCQLFFKGDIIPFGFWLPSNSEKCMTHTRLPPKIIQRRERWGWRREGRNGGMQREEEKQGNGSHPG